MRIYKIVLLFTGEVFIHKEIQNRNSGKHCQFKPFLTGVKDKKMLVLENHLVVGIFLSGW